MTCRSPAAGWAVHRRWSTIVATGLAAVGSGCRAAPSSTATASDVSVVAVLRGASGTAPAAGCAALDGLARATPAEEDVPRSDAATGMALPVVTPERLPHVRYTFESQSEAALATYLRQWRDSVTGRAPAEVAALPQFERAVYDVYGAFRFGPGAPLYLPDAPLDGDGAARPAPDGPESIIILPTVVVVGCADRLSLDEARALIGRERFSQARWIHLTDFRPPSPAPERTLYLTADEALSLHHFLGLDRVDDPPLGPVAVAPLAYPEASDRFDWLRRALPIAHRSGGGAHLLTPPAAFRIVLDAAVEHAVVDYRSGPSSGGSLMLARDGSGWRITEYLGGWIE